MTASISSRRAAAARSSRSLEHWSVDAGDGDVAHLDIPPDAQRERSFEISCSLVVAQRGGDDDDPAWHALKVLVDGAQQWSRRAATHPGPRDSLDLQFRRVVPSGQPLRLTAIAQVHRAARLRLTIVAEEEG